MRAILLSLAFCAAVQAVPLPSPGEATTILTTRDDDVFEESPPGAHFTADETEEQDLDQDEEEKGSQYLNGDDDPAFAPIFAHVEEILASISHPAKDRIQYILDAIVHVKESWRDAADYNEDDDDDNSATRLSPEQVVDEIFDILGGKISDEEKIDEIFEEIIQHTSHSLEVGSGDEKEEEEVLNRVSWIMTGPESAQKRIQMMLNELAEYLHPESLLQNGEDLQETFGDVEDEGKESKEIVGADVLDDVDVGESRETVEGEKVESVWR